MPKISVAQIPYMGRVLTFAIYGVHDESQVAISKSLKYEQWHEMMFLRSGHWLILAFEATVR
jgi:hypothetical protein